MKKILFPLLIILVLASLVAAGAYALSRTGAAQTLTTTGRHSREGFERPRAFANQNLPPGGAGTGGPFPGERRNGERMSFLHGIAEVLKNLALISIVIGLIVAAQKVLAVIRSRRHVSTP